MNLPNVQGLGENPVSVSGGIWQIPGRRLVESAGSFIDSGVWHATGTRFFSMQWQAYFMQIAN
jgi:hypothetical protein